MIAVPFALCNARAIRNSQPFAALSSRLAGIAICADVASLIGVSDGHPPDIIIEVQEALSASQDSAEWRVGLDCINVANCLV
jgi:hypothetical protein